MACAIDQLGRQLATRQAVTTPAGYRALLAWAQSLGEVEAWGVEGTGCHGAGLARFLDGQGQLVLAGQATAIPKAGSHLVEMVRCLRVARTTASKARIQAPTPCGRWS